MCCVLLSKISWEGGWFIRNRWKQTGIWQYRQTQILYRGGYGYENTDKQKHHTDRDMTNEDTDKQR